MDYKNTTHINLDTKPIDNKTYVECHGIHEENTESRLDYIASLWKTTNFWLSIIGLYFLGKIISAIIKMIGAITIGYNIADFLL